MSNLIEAISQADLSRTLEHLASDDPVNLERLKIEINRCHFSQEELDIIWPILKTKFPSVADFLEYFGKSEYGFPFICKEMTVDQLQGIYLGAIYYGNKEVVDYMNSTIEFEKTPEFISWFDSCTYQAQAIK